MSMFSSSFPFGRGGLIASVVIFSRAVAYFTVSAFDKNEALAADISVNVVSAESGEKTNDDLSTYSLGALQGALASIDETLFDAFGEAAYAICAFAVVACLGALSRKPEWRPRSVAEAITTRAARKHSQVTRLPASGSEILADGRHIKKAGVPPVQEHRLQQRQRQAFQALTEQRMNHRAKVDTLTLSGAAGGESLSIGQLISVLRGHASRHCFRDALHAHDQMSNQIGAGSGTMWSLLLYCAVEAHEFRRAEEFYTRLCAFQAPSNHDFVNMVRFCVHFGDVPGLIRLLRDLRNMSASIDVIARNRALAVCIHAQALELAEAIVGHLPQLAMDVVGYNTFMKGFLQAGEYRRCFELYTRMREDGVECSEMTFGIMLDASLGSQNEHMVRQIFKNVQESGVELNVVHYTTFIKGLVSAGAFDDAISVLDQMNEKDIKPDLVTYTTLLKAHASVGDVTGAIRVHDLMLKQGIVPDVIVYHVLLTSCSVKAKNPDEVLRMFDWIVKLGFKPTTTTLSILVKVFAKSGSFRAMLHLLEVAPKQFDLWPEPRIYAQLAHACVTANQGSEAVEVYVAMVRCAILRDIPVDRATNNRLSRLCMSANESAVASKIFTMITTFSGRPRTKVLDEIVAEWRKSKA